MEGAQSFKTFGGREEKGLGTFNRFVSEGGPTMLSIPEMTNREKSGLGAHEECVWERLWP